MSRTLLVACGVTACLAWTPTRVSTSPQQPSSPAAQAPAPDPALTELAGRFVAATDAERIALVQAHAEILQAPFRQILSQQGVNQRNDGAMTESERTFTALLFLGRQYRQPITEINALLGLGAVEGVRSEFRKSRAYLQEAYDLSIANTHVPGQQQALSNLATVKRRTGDTKGAFDSLNESLVLARQVGDPLAIARVLNNFGITYNDIGLGARALEFYNQSLALKEQNNATAVEITNTLSNIGGVFAGQGDYTTALDYFRRALAKIEGSSRLDSVTSVYNNLGQVYASLSDYTTARRYLTQGLALAERIEDATRMATALYLLATIDLAEGKLDASEATQRRALAVREAAGDRLGVIESLTEMASLLDRRSRHVDAVPYGERAVELATESRLINQLWKAQLTLGHIHYGLGHDAIARRLYEEAIENIENVRHLAAGGERTRQRYM
nr:tetratricopeptide repeat protein [Acidobacteriota bacterium]